MFGKCPQVIIDIVWDQPFSFFFHNIFYLHFFLIVFLWRQIWHKVCGAPINRKKCNARPKAASKVVDENGHKTFSKKVNQKQLSKIFNKNVVKIHQCNLPFSTPPPPPISGEQKRGSARNAASGHIELWHLLLASLAWLTAKFCRTVSLQWMSASVQWLAASYMPV